MRKTLTAVAAAVALSLAAVASPTTASARCFGCGVAAGVIGGIAAGALIAGATHPYYGPYPYYAYGPAPYYYRPHCWWRRERVWDGYGWHWAHVRICR